MHIKTQHAQKWKEYREFENAKEKIAFFVEYCVPLVKTMIVYFEGDGYLQYLINKSIVKIIIGDLLFHLDDVEEVIHSRPLSHFKLRSVEDASDDDLQRMNTWALSRGHNNFFFASDT